MGFKEEYVKPEFLTVNMAFRIKNYSITYTSVMRGFRLPENIEARQKGTTFLNLPALKLRQTGTLEILQNLLKDSL